MDLEIQEMIGAMSRLNLDGKLNADRKISELNAYARHLDEEIARMDDLVAREFMTKKTRKLEREKLCSKIMTELKRYQNPFKKEIEALQSQLLSRDGENSKTDLEKVLRHFQRAELRQAYGLFNMTPVDIESQLSNDPLFIDAVITSPKQLLPSERISELVREKAEAENPDLAKEMAKVEIADKTISNIAAAIEQSILATGFQGADELVRVAEGA